MASGNYCTTWQTIPIISLNGINFRYPVGEISALGFYAACVGSCSPTFRDSLSVSYSRVKQLDP